MRIASLLPAATEIVGALGLGDRLAAVTFECDHPTGIRDRCPVVVDTALRHESSDTERSAGGAGTGMAPARIDEVVRDRVARGLPMYDLDRDALARVDPDLILTQDLCRVCALPQATVEEAQTAIGTHARVLSLDPHTLDEAFATITDVADAAGAPAAGEALLAGLHARLDTVAAAVAGRPAPRVLALEWTDPPFLPGHWVPELVSRAGGEPVGAIPGGRSVAVDWVDLPAPVDVVLVAPCGFGLDDAIAQAGAVRDRLPGGVPVVALDSASFVVRAGPRLVDGIEAIAWALHPDAVPAPPPGRIARLP